MSKKIWHFVESDYVKVLALESSLRSYRRFWIIRFLTWLQKSAVCPYCGFVISTRWKWQSYNSHVHCGCSFRLEDGMVKNPCTIVATYKG